MIQIAFSKILTKYNNNNKEQYINLLQVLLSVVSRLVEHLFPSENDNLSSLPMKLFRFYKNILNV